MTSWRRLTSIMAAGVLLASGSAGAASPHHSERSTVDRADARTGPQLHLIYFVPDGETDQRLDLSPDLRAALGRMQTWFRSQSGGLTWRFDTRKDNQDIDITFVAGRQALDRYGTDATSASFKIDDELASRGYAREGKKYVILLSGGFRNDIYCGVTNYDTGNLRNYTPANDGYPTTRSNALIPLDSSPYCHSRDWGHGSKPGWFQGILMHEMLHTQGLVPPGALHTCEAIPGHVCTAKGPLATSSTFAPLDPEEPDVMYPAINRPLSDSTLDIGRDDYLDEPLGTLDLRHSPYVLGGTPQPRLPSANRAARGPVLGELVRSFRCQLTASLTVPDADRSRWQSSSPGTAGSVVHPTRR